VTRRPNAPDDRAQRPFSLFLPPDRFDRPAFEFDRRLHALERAFYRHLLRVIDLDALFGLELRLWSLLCKHGRLTDDQVLDLSNVIIERALEHVGRDPIRAMRLGVIGPDGRVTPAPETPHERCPFCDSDSEAGDGDPDDGDDDPEDGKRGPDNGGGAPSAGGALAERACFTRADAR
jgi:hypothetical protein